MCTGMSRALKVKELDMDKRRHKDRYGGRLTDHPGAMANGSSFQIVSPAAIGARATSPLPFARPKKRTSALGVHRATSRPSMSRELGQTWPPAGTPLLLPRLAAEVCTSPAAWRTFRVRLSLTVQSVWAESRSAWILGMPSVGLLVLSASSAALRSSSEGLIGDDMRVLSV